jgi:hypothetical protein
MNLMAEWELICDLYIIKLGTSSLIIEKFVNVEDHYHTKDNEQFQHHDRSS